jgi:hypothetical protein
VATSLSGKARAIVEREREAAARRVEELRTESKALRSLAEQVDEELRRSSQSLQHAEELLGIAPQVPIDALNGELRGRRLREVAIELLRMRKGDEAEIHYREWFELLRAHGVRVGGKDPAATFLAQIAGASDVESVRPRSGLYRLKTSA